MSEGIMDKSYMWQGEYGKRNHLIPVFSEILDNQDATSLTMLALFINNNPYNFEFFIALSYEKLEKEHIQETIEAFENAGLRYRSDLTTHSLLLEMGNRRFVYFERFKRCKKDFPSCILVCRKSDFGKKRILYEAFR